MIGTDTASLSIPVSLQASRARTHSNFVIVSLNFIVLAKICVVTRL